MLTEAKIKTMQRELARHGKPCGFRDACRELGRLGAKARAYARNRSKHETAKGRMVLPERDR